VEAECKKSRDQVDPVEGANTGVFGAAPGILRRAATDWWSNEDSNQGPGQFYRRRDRCAIVVEAARPRALILFAALAMQTSIRRGCSDSKLSELFAPRRRKIGKAGNPDAAG
jgi:hypothetical protein